VSDATIVIDVQNGFTRFGNLASPRCLAAVPRIAGHVQKAIARGDFLIFTADWHGPDDLEFKMFPEHCVEGSEEAEIVDELKPYLSNASLVRKRRFSAFFGSELDRIIADIAPGLVSVVGVCTDICVLHTVADLRNRDVDVRVIREAVETFDGPGHPADEVNTWALGHMRAVLGAEIVDA
jgi:nicotinamidase/pyrazinamidase